ncbi:MAG: hypothetical protein AAGD38_22250 [Acidobacteriota bacterium]
MRIRLPLFILLMLIPSLALAQPPQPQGPDFPVNTNTSGDQGAPDVASEDDGAFVIVWESDGQDGDSWGIYGRVFDDDSSGGTEILFPQTTMGAQRDPAVAMTLDGEFVVAWSSPDSDGPGIKARLFKEDGAAIIGDQNINETTIGQQIKPDVGIYRFGDFEEGGMNGWVVLVVWQGPDSTTSDIWARLFAIADDGAGTIIEDTGEFRVNSITSGPQGTIRVSTVATSKQFAVVWEGPDADASGVYITFIDASNPTMVPTETLVNTTTDGTQTNPSVITTPDGKTVVAWEGPDSDGTGVFAQAYDDQGMAVGGEKQVNDNETGDQDSPSLSIGEDGEAFTLVWRSTAPLPSSSLPITEGSPIFIHGRTLSGPGASRLGPEWSVDDLAFRGNGPGPPDTPITINSSGTDVLNPRVAAKRDADFTVVWESVGLDGPGSSGIYARRFVVPIFVDDFETGDTSAWSSTVP